MIYQNLKAYSDSDYYPFHMPGHKRKQLFEGNYSIDITEIDGFDDLHHPEGILREAMEKAANVYQADKSFFVVNGSTCGILSAISAVTKIGDTILIGRNCHKSVYHAMALRNLKGVYVYPEMTGTLNICGQINPYDVEQILKKNPHMKAFVMVSPTYEGVVSDIKSIAEIVHKYGVILIVDEAHGAHFCFHDAFPISAIQLGADIVIQSLHKTLPCMTQTAIVHWKKQQWNKNETIVEQLQKYLSMYETSSPSYVLMASMEEGIHWMAQQKRGKVQTYVDNLEKFRQQCGQLQYIHLFEEADMYCKKNEKNNTNIVEQTTQIWYDKSKLVFGTGFRKYSGKWLYENLLEQYHLQMEMCTPDYCLAMTSVMDDEVALERLYQALCELDKRIQTERQQVELPIAVYSPAPCAQSKMSWYEATTCLKQVRPLVHASGFVVAEPVYLYPPGIPIVVPGELLTEEMVRLICHYRQEGFSLRGMEDETGEYIAVVREEHG